ncbi:MAG TPA: carbohydrate ABC transporter permease [Candidatus Faecivivens stercoravium]|uniref:Carbohydrate ABC transporter permease n=1 Tax=Candidatus Faecivivens stercoravium TaxID=2840803 RepID=A0A9D1DY11_9FIRM|nr:carbohydrate ABC transporter permease [Candidatus Faecivivens stercoravium]
MAMVRNKSIGSRVFNFVNIVFFAFVIIACILPVWHVFCASFSDAGWVLNQSGIIWQIHDFSLTGYKLVFENANIWTGYLNTFFYVIANTALGMLLTVMGAYALSRKDFLWANPVMLGISFTMLFSGGIIPSYILVTQYLDMYDSRWALIIPTCMNAFNLILIRTALQNVPASLEESAMLDGAGRFTILFRIMLPLIKATLATVVLYFVIGNWNSWFNAMIYLRTRSKFPLQLVLREILITASDAATTGTVTSSTETGDTALYRQLTQYCTIIVSTVPIFIFYPFIQKYFESGVMIGAIKG